MAKPAEVVVSSQRRVWWGRAKGDWGWGGGVELMERFWGGGVKLREEWGVLWVLS